MWPLLTPNSFQGSGTWVCASECAYLTCANENSGLSECLMSFLGRQYCTCDITTLCWGELNTLHGTPLREDSWKLADFAFILWLLILLCYNKCSPDYDYVLSCPTESLNLEVVVGPLTHNYLRQFESQIFKLVIILSEITSN